MADWTKTGTSKAGVNEGRKVQCSKSVHHGFHPQNEDCPDCAPPELKKTYRVEDVQISIGGIRLCGMYTEAPAPTEAVLAWSWRDDDRETVDLYTATRAELYAVGRKYGVPRLGYTDEAYRNLLWQRLRDTLDLRAVPV